MQINSDTTLVGIAEQAVASGEWWKESAPSEPDLVLPTRVLAALENAGITTVEQLKAAGPDRLRKLGGIGKGGFDQIVALLRALDRRGNGAAQE